jgi:predicted dehydrogenase
VVGGNFGASFFWHRHPNSEVVAVCDLREDRIGRLKKTYNQGARGYTRYQEMIESGGLDAVAVFTPAPLHVEMAIQALEAGLHVVSAVPAATSLADCERLLAAVRKSGATYMMAETSFYRPEVIWAREAREAGRFGTIFYTEAEYYHQGLYALWYDDQKRPTWRYAFPPLHYITHASSMVISVTGERLVSVSAQGWGDGRAELRDNPNRNPYMNEAGLYRTSGGGSARIAVFRDIAIGGAERANWFGTKLTYRMPQPGGLTGVLGFADQKMEPFRPPNYWDRLPESLRTTSGHGGSHTFLTHEFVTALAEKRRPAVDIYEALAYTAPGFAGHQSAMEGGAVVKVRDFGRPTTPG